MTYSIADLPKLKKNQIKEAAQMFSRAFHDDPLAIWFFPDEEMREEMLTHYFKVRIKLGFLFGEVYSTSSNLEGLAVWLPSTAIKITNWKIFRAGGMSLYSKFDKEVIEKMTLISNFSYEIHHRLANFPHWYLAPIGVDPVHQGKGYASKPMRSMLKRLDEEEIPCYLETQMKTNVEIYLHYGFDIVEETTIPHTDIPHWVMLRKPH